MLSGHHKVILTAIAGLGLLWCWPEAPADPPRARIDNGDVPAAVVIPELTIDWAVPNTVGSPAPEPPEELPPVSSPPVINGPLSTNDPTAFPEEMAEPVEEHRQPVESSFQPLDLSSHAFHVRNSRGIAGTAVSVGPTMLVTAYHIASGGSVSVYIDGQWRPARVQPVPRASPVLRDAAVLHVANTSLPSLSIRSPEYYESVSVYGLRTARWQAGFVSGNRFVSLRPAESGIANGDSGGLVVGADGALLGIISGFESADTTLGTPANPRVVSIVSSDIFGQLVRVPVSQPVAAPKSAGSAPLTQQSPHCVEDNCIQYQYQPKIRFRPNRNRGK